MVFRIPEMGFFSSCYTFFYLASQTVRMDLKKIIIDLLRIIYIIIIIFVAYQVLKAIFGGTWASENIIIAGMGIILAGLFVIVGFLISQVKSIGILEERTKNIGESLSHLGIDFKNHVLEKHR